MKATISIVSFLIFTIYVSLDVIGQNTYSTKGSGTVSGTVTILEKKMFGGLKEKEDVSGVVVYLTGFESKPPSKVPTLVQEKRTFNPKVLPVVAGQTVSFPNLDGIYHNVFSVSPVKSFDLGQYKSTDPPKDVTFDKPGLVPVFCNIHPQMISFVLVLENGAFSETGKEGKFNISKVPPGRYTINAWKPKTQRVGTEIEVKSGQEIVVNLELKETVKIPPHKRKDGTNYPGEDDDWES